MGKDIVAIDMAGLDMINKKAGKPVLDELWHKDVSKQIKAAAELGMGSLVYEIKDV